MAQSNPNNSSGIRLFTAIVFLFLGGVFLFINYFNEGTAITVLSLIFIISGLGILPSSKNNPTEKSAPEKAEKSEMEVALPITSITEAATSTRNAATMTDRSHKEIFQAADKLYKTLADMSADRQVTEILDGQQSLQQAMVLDIGGGEIDKRLVVLATTDLIRCYEGLGHTPDMSTGEGQAIGIGIMRILMPQNNDILENYEVLQTASGKEILEDGYNIVKTTFCIDYDPDKFLLIDLLKQEGIDEEIIRKWAVALYRYILLIAKADGRLSDAEQKWLTSILSFTENGGTPACPAPKNVVLPPEFDPLFADVARFIVSGQNAATSSIQRRYAIGYNRAGRIMDQLESAGIVGPAKGGKPRDVLIGPAELEDRLSSMVTAPGTADEIVTPAEEISPKKVHRRNASDPLKELESLIGLTGVKNEIANIYNLVKVQKVRQSKGLNVPDISYHCVFTGNPGTGKTTVARLVGQIYKKLGILSKGHLVETDRSGLVAEYVGQTAVKTNKIIDSALDGVLFIDEAYSLVQNGGGNDFGLEAIATLLKRMEDNRDRLVVILAGYSDEMETFINANPGLQSRFNRYIRFEDYSADELASIYEFNLSKYDYKMTPEAADAIKRVMTEAVAGKDKNFGNARFVRNLFEKTLERQAKRLASSSLTSLTEEALAEITDEDIQEF